MHHLLLLAARPCRVQERSQFQLKDVTFGRAQVKMGCNFRYKLKEEIVYAQPIFQNEVFFSSGRLFIKFRMTDETKYHIISFSFHRLGWVVIDF